MVYLTWFFPLLPGSSALLFYSLLFPFLLLFFVCCFFLFVSCSIFTVWPFNPFSFFISFHFFPLSLFYFFMLFYPLCFLFLSPLVHSFLSFSILGCRVAGSSGCRVAGLSGCRVLLIFFPQAFRSVSGSVLWKQQDSIINFLDGNGN